jgi:hypothetical protein
MARVAPAASEGRWGLLSPEIDWSIWAKKRAAIKMGFEDNHGWSSESAPARVFLVQIRPCIFIVI